MTHESGEQIRFWQARELGGVELLHAHYIEQRFAPHVHEGFVFTVIEGGAQRFRHRGSEHLAPVGSMVLINPDELHTAAPRPTSTAGVTAPSTRITPRSAGCWPSWS